MPHTHTPTAQPTHPVEIVNDDPSETRSHSTADEDHPEDPRNVTEQFIRMDDGTRVYVRVHTPNEPEEGPPLVLCDGLGCEGYIWNYLIRDLGPRRRIIYWQYRGHGKSEVPNNLDTLTLQTVVRDLEKVLDTVHVEQAVLGGHSMGVQVALEAYRAFPSRVVGLFLMCGSFEYPLATWHNSADRNAPPTFMNLAMQRLFPYISTAFIDFNDFVQPVWSRIVPTKLAYELAVRTEVNGRLIREADFMPYLLHLGTMDMRVFARLARELATHSAADILADIHIPTLIIGAGHDTFTPVWLSEEMHKRIPDSEYLFITDGTHAAPIEHSTLINLRVEKFLRERVPMYGANGSAPAPEHKTVDTRKNSNAAALQAKHVGHETDALDTDEGDAFSDEFSGDQSTDTPSRLAKAAKRSTTRQRDALRDEVRRLQKKQALLRLRLGVDLKRPRS